MTDLPTAEHLAGTSRNIRAAANLALGAADRLDEVREMLAEAQADPEAARAVRMVLLRMRGEAAALADQFAALAREGAP